MPLTSPKDKFRDKKSSVDFIKIFDESKKLKGGRYKLIGVININNMIPVTDNVISRIDLSIKKDDTPAVRHYKELMQNQLRWCRKNVDVIENRANKVYRLVVTQPDKRSLQFKKLERIADKYTP